MKNMSRSFVAILIVTLLCGSSAFAAPGDTWNVGDGIRASIPGGDLAAAANPVTVGDATWTFRQGGGTAPYTTAVNDIRSAHGAFVELPADGLMWFNGGLPSMTVFDGPSTLLPCEGGTSSCTNYGANDVGGYTSTGAVFTTLTGGEFKVTWGGYAGRDFVNTPPRFIDAIMFSGPAPYYNTDPHPGGRTLQGVQPITQVSNLGAANAVTNTFTVTLAAGEAFDLYINNGVGSLGGGDWAGMIFTVEEIPEPATMALLGLGSLLLRRRTKRS